MKQKYPVILLVIAAIVYALGVMFKITHAPGADKMLLVSKILGGIGAVLFIYSLATDTKSQQ
jgi:hypothetical protein